MNKEESLVKRMIKEEWRMHSTLYRGKSFAFFPVLVFLFTFIFAYATTQYSTLGHEPIGTTLTALAAFIGLAIGNLNYSGREAWKNVLGDTNYLIYSSRTLPISRKNILTQLIAKELIYYTTLFLAPVALGGLLGTGLQTTKSILLMIPAFLTGIIIGLTTAQITLKKSTPKLIDYRKLNFLKPVANKSILDILRSSGGIFKIIFSLGLLTAFYWYAVLYFPFTQIFLNNPLISYSIMIGLLNLTIYNWLNRFDNLKDYKKQPLNKTKILNNKKQAYLTTTIPTTIILITLSAIIYPQHYILSLTTAITMTIYNLAIAIHTTGLKPNNKMFNTKTFTKYLLLQNLIAGPLLATSIIYTPKLQNTYLTILTITAIVSTTYLYKH